MDGQAISTRRLKKVLEHAVEGDPYYWYGVVEPDAGSLWPTLFCYRSEAAELADKMGGFVVIVAARILEDEDGEHIEPEN